MELVAWTLINGGKTKFEKSALTLQWEFFKVNINIFLSFRNLKKLLGLAPTRDRVLHISFLGLRIVQKHVNFKLMEGENPLRCTT
jgi:hypothetical protein